MTTRLFTCLLAAAALAAAVPFCTATAGETEPTGQDAEIGQTLRQTRDRAEGLEAGKSLLQIVGEGIHDGRARIKKMQESLYTKARQLDLDPEVDLRALYEEMKVERKDLFLERVFQDVRLSAQTALRKIYRRARDSGVEGGDRDALLRQVDEMFVTYYERRLARLQARWDLAEAVTDEERKSAEEKLTLREQQLEEVRADLISLLHEHHLMEPGENLP